MRSSSSRSLEPPAALLIVLHELGAEPHAGDRRAEIVAGGREQTHAALHRLRRREESELSAFAVALTSPAPSLPAAPGGWRFQAPSRPATALLEQHERPHHAIGDEHGDGRHPARDEPRATRAGPTQGSRCERQVRRSAWPAIRWSRGGSTATSGAFAACGSMLTGRSSAALRAKLAPSPRDGARALPGAVGAGSSPLASARRRAATSRSAAPTVR